MTQYHIAELNIAQMIAPIDSPMMAEFKNNLDRIYDLAEQSPGFVWRLKDFSDDPTAMHVFDNDALLFTLSVWQSVDALSNFVYKTDHTDFYRRRREWFDKMSIPVVVRWWVPDGENPTLASAKAKLDYLKEHGPTPLAFTFKQSYTPDEMLAFNSNPA